MELAGQGYRQLAEEIGGVLQAAAETAEKMQDEARAEADRIRARADDELRNAYAEGRRILDEARMEADMVRAEAEWQSQEILAQARRRAAEQLTGANLRLSDIDRAEAQVLERLAGVGQFLAQTMATLRESQRETVLISPDVDVPAVPDGRAHDDRADDARADDASADDASADDASADQPSAKVYFVEFPPLAPPEPEPGRVDSSPDPEEDGCSGGHPRTPGVLTETPGASLFNSERERSEWAPPPEMPTWWTRGNAQG